MRNTSSWGGLLGIASMCCLATACTPSPTGPAESLVPGVLEGWGRAPQFSADVEGRRLEVSVTTYGWGGCRRRGTLEVAVDYPGHSVTVEPRDWAVLPEPDICEDVLLAFGHTLSTELVGAGEWTVRVVGSRRDGTHMTPDTLEATVAVDVTSP